MLKPLSSAILFTLCFNSAIAQEAPTELDPITVNGDAVGSGGQDVVNVGGSGPWDWTSDDTAERDDDGQNGINNNCQGGKVAQNKIVQNLTATGVSCRDDDRVILRKVCRERRSLWDMVCSIFKPGNEGLICTNNREYKLTFKDGTGVFVCNAVSSQHCGYIKKKNAND